MAAQQRTLHRSPSAQLRKEKMEAEILSFGPRVFQNVAASEASKQNTPIFTRSLVQRAAREVELVRRGKGTIGEGRNTITIPHMRGCGVIEIRLRRRGAETASLNWLSIVAIAELEGRTPGYYITTGNQKQFDEYSDIEMLKGPIDMFVSTDRLHHIWKRIKQMPIPPALESVKGFEPIVLESKIWRSLQSRLDVLTVRIENIVCVALGRHEDSKEGVSFRASTQHLLACFASKYLSQRYAGASGVTPSIPILARDPAYTFEDVRLLSHLEPPITVVSDPYQYLAITPSTLIIAICAPVLVPFLDIAADICFPPGPAAILSHEIANHPWHKDGLVVTFELWTPRVGRMLEGMDVVWLNGEDGAQNRVDQEWGKNLHWYARKE